MSILSVADNIYSFRLIRLLMRDWKDWDAYKRGLIDENGKRTKKKAKGSEDKNSWTRFTRIAANIKRTLEKIPGGKTKVISALAAFKLLKEDEGNEEEVVLQYAMEICESLVAGDTGGNSQFQASGENSGSVVLSPTTKKNKKKKKPLKRFTDFS